MKKIVRFFPKAVCTSATVTALPLRYFSVIFFSSNFRLHYKLIIHIHRCLQCIKYYLLLCTLDKCVSLRYLLIDFSSYEASQNRELKLSHYQHENIFEINESICHECEEHARTCVGDNAPLYQSCNPIFRCVFSNSETKTICMLLGVKNACMSIF